MKPKVVSLTVHKNTLAKRQSKAVRQMALDGIKAMMADLDEPRAFALVAIDSDGTPTTFTYSGQMTGPEFALVLRSALAPDLMMTGMDDAFDDVDEEEGCEP